jgi:hypothetical protein
VRPGIVLLLVFLLAGCATPSETLPPTTSGTASALPAQPHTESRTFAYAAGVGQDGVIAFQPDGFRAGSFEVPANVTALVIEAQWTCTTPSCTYRLHYAGPDEHDVVGSTGNGAVSATVSGDDSRAGVWDIGLYPEGAAADIQGETRLTWFFGPVPAGFTAFP